MPRGKQDGGKNARGGDRGGKWEGGGGGLSREQKKAVDALVAAQEKEDKKKEEKRIPTLELTISPLSHRLKYLHVLSTRFIPERSSALFGM